MNGLLNTIKSPEDLKGLSSEQLKQLCSEIRSCIIHTVSVNGGHLASISASLNLPLRCTVRLALKKTESYGMLAISHTPIKF